MPRPCHNDSVSSDESVPKRLRPFKQRTVAMGEPRVDLDKALALASQLEDEDTIARLSLGDRDPSAASEIVGSNTRP